MISITAQIYTVNDLGEQTVFGLFGMNFNLTVFPQTIDPLIENESSDYADNLLYWVFPVK